MLRVLDLFSGIGGFSLGLERTGGFETAAFCEYAEWPRKVLAKHWPNVPIFEDVCTLKGSDIDGPIDVVVGGYPCQPFSTAGRRKGKEDDRHLWPEFNRLVAELRPTWVIGENVAGHISMGLDDVLSDLEGQGYSARTFVIPACATGAPHRRDRVWTLAYCDSATQHELPSEGHDAGEGQSGVFDGQARHVADAIGSGQSGQREHEQPSDCQAQGEGQADNVEPERQPRKRRIEPGMGGMADGLPAGMDGPCRWPREPDIPRVAKGIKDRANRLKALGNAVVPQIPEMIGRAILETEENG
jgi:DNA (cytosine-5)-methyltransferase 1